MTTVKISAKQSETLLPSLAKEGLLALAASGFVALCAQWELMLPHSPVPLNFQTFAVLGLGLALGPFRSFMALCLYLLEGALGYPVFSGGVGGLHYLVCSSAGFLWAFPLSAALVGFLWKPSMNKTTTFAILCLASFVYFGFGWLWLAQFVGYSAAYTLGVAPFLIGCAIKFIGVIVLFPRLRPYVLRAFGQF